MIILETASLNEAELAEYARKKGLYVEQIKAWKDACMNANGGIAKEAARCTTVAFSDNNTIEDNV